MSDERTADERRNETKLYGCKLLRLDHTSLSNEYGRVQYCYGWQNVPGNGAYIAITGGVGAAGVPADVVIRWFECDPASEIELDDPLSVGVRCFRRVRMLRRKPKGVLPLAEKRGRIIIVQGWYSNGKQSYRRSYRDGRLHGTSEAWREDGSRIYRHEYRDERLHGTSETWREDGSRIYRHEYRDGRLHGTSEAWREDGSPIYWEEYCNGRAHGTWKRWHPNGQIAYRCEYCDGEQIV